MFCSRKIMKRQGLIKLVLLVWFLIPAIAQAQKLEWNLDVNGFFDNSEGENHFRPTKTMDGLRLSPEVGLSWDEGKNAIYGGYTGLAEWGTKDAFSDGDAIVYYKYDWKPLTFLFGSFSRDNLLGEYPSYMVCDSIRYYRPNIQGFTFQYQTDKGHLEMFLDWTGEQSEKEREQFMAGLSTAFRFRHLKLGIEGYYYHYALEANSDSTEHIHDFLVAHPFVGLTYKNLGFLDSLNVRVGALMSFDRERADIKKWYTPVGFLGEMTANWKRLELKETLYAGGHQQHFGNSSFGKYYWGDTYMQSHFYSRTDVSYQIIKSSFVDTYVALTFNATKYGLNCHQMVVLRANLGTRQRPRKWIR
jgi:hypothetical protein